MTHFAESDLADFARGVRVSRRKELQAHLTACSKCRKGVDIWHGIREAAEARASAQAPASSLRMVKGAFALHRPRKASRMSQLATLMFDSFLQPAMQEGVRGVPASLGENGRQLLYRGGSYVVDLHMERQGDTGIVVLVGQVFDLSKKGGYNVVRVVLERDHAILAAAVATEFGEFIFEYEDTGEMRLRLETLGQKPLTIPLTAPQKPEEAPIVALARAGY
jgi:hypothetical protein